MKFIEIPPSFLDSISHDNVRTPSLYYHSNFLIRKFFWLRLRVLYALIKALSLKDSKEKDECLDFGGGSGVFLPTLSQLFRHVVCIDLDTRDAQDLVKQYAVSNVSIVEDSVDNLSDNNRFSVVVAADVLEHFSTLEMPVRKIRQVIKPNGYLLTSLPTENWLYVLLRRAFGIQKPPDHYHTSYEVEKYLEGSGFSRVRRRCIPLSLLPLFSISVWTSHSVE